MTTHNTDQVSPKTFPDETSSDRTIAIRQAISAGDRGLVLANMDDFARFAMKVAASQFCPPGFSEVDCFIVLQCGAELGLSPMTSLQSFYVVNNRASLFGDMPKALVERSGLMLDYTQEEIGTYPNDDYGYRIESLRKGRSKPLITKYTVADAKIAKKWPGKDNSPWATAPKRMLMFRARGFNLRDNFSDVLKGFQISELVDEETVAGFEHAKRAVVLEQPQTAAEKPLLSEPARRRGRPPKTPPEAPQMPVEPSSRAGDSPHTIGADLNAPESIQEPRPLAEQLLERVLDAGFTEEQMLSAMVSRKMAEPRFKTLAECGAHHLLACVEQWPAALDLLQKFTAAQSKEQPAQNDKLL